MGGYFLEEPPEGDSAHADSVVEDIGGIGVFSAQLDQLPHQPIGLIHGQLIPSRDSGVDAIVAIVMNFRLQVRLGAIVMGDADAQISLFHVCFLPFCSSLGTSIVYQKMR